MPIFNRGEREICPKLLRRITFFIRGFYSCYY